MEQSQLVSSCSRTLPTSHALPRSPAPTNPLHPLLLLQNAPSSSTSVPSSSSAPKLTLVRLSGGMDRVWDWSPPPPPPPPAPAPGAGPVKPLNRLQMMKGKGKAALGEIRTTVWAPGGQFLCVGVSSAPGTKESATLHVLDLHAGQSTLAPASLPGPSSAISHISWHSTPAPPTSSSIIPTSSAQTLIQQLPPLPTLSKEPVLSAPGGAAGAPGGPGAVGGPGSALFGAKAAMLQKEREKEAGRAISVRAAAPNFPTLLAPALGATGSEGREVERSLLVVGTAAGQAHLYLGGTVRLSTLQLEDETILSADVLDSPSGGTDLSLLSVDKASADLLLRRATVSLPPSLPLLLAQSTLLRTHLSHACESLQQARSLWDEARRLGKSWTLRLAELSKNHAVEQSPTTQLLFLLATGRASPALHDYLSSKMNERSLAKWESSTAEVLARLKNCLWMDVAPSLERVLLLLDELKAWSIWPKHFSSFSLDRPALSRAAKLCAQVIRAAAELERKAAEEERNFAEFSAWLRYELEKVSALDGSDIAPRANFLPLPVGHYLAHSLTESALAPYLAFGLGTSPIESSTELAEVRAWIAREPLKVDGKEGLQGMLKRMKEELKGQLDAQRVVGSNLKSPTKGGAPEMMATEAMPARGTTSEDKAPLSLPALLHVLVETISGVMENAVQKVGEVSLVGEPVRVGRLEEMGGEMLGRVRSVKALSGGEECLVHAWIDEGVLSVVRSGSRELEIARLELRTNEGGASEPISMALSPTSVALVTRDENKTGKTFHLHTLSLASLSYLRLDPEDNYSAPPPVGWTSSDELDARQPPEGMALGSEGDYVVLGSEGRRIEVLSPAARGAIEEGEGMEH